MNKTLSYILIISLLTNVGCYSSKYVSKDILLTSELGEPAGVVTIIMKDEKRIVVEQGTYELVGDTLHITGLKPHAYFLENIDVNIAFDDILTVEIEEIDDFATTGCVIGLASLVTFIIIAVATANQYHSPKKCSYEDKG